MNTTSRSLARRLTLALACTSLLALAACDMDPNPSASRKSEFESTRLAVTRLGQPFEVDGCQVQAHRVTTSSAVPDFTLATVNCPTAQVSTTTASCGKSCINNVVRVERKAGTEDSPAQPSAEQAAQARELREKLRKLNEQVKSLEKDLQGVEKTLGKS